ncbi:MAG TPA: S-layer homology domain-containing protein [Acidimicrobiales bacterium]|nr:S-layer homology domain-containing protein [Acidimicrobiales bacterium]
MANRSRATPGRVRVAAVAAAIALVGAALSGPAWSQASAQARDISAFACPGNEVPEDGFADTDGTTFEADVDCIAWYGISSGQSSASFAPTGTVSRSQMATFVRNLVDYVDGDALAARDDGSPAFACASNPGELAGDVHATSIELLADAGIVQGGPGGLPEDCFGPRHTVSRAQMATFIAEALRFLGASLGHPVPGDYFDDDGASVHEASIDAVASAGIVAGTGTRTYDPGAEIRRGQMAAFLARTLDHLVEVGATGRPAPAGADPAAAAEQRFVQLINQERANHGLGALTVDPAITSVARNWSAKMAGSGGGCGSSALGHNPDYPSQMPPGWIEVAENVTCGPSVESNHEGLMSSPSHRENILAGQFTHVGVGVVVGADGLLWVTQNFGQY